MKNIKRYVNILAVLLCFITLLSSCRPPNGYLDDIDSVDSDTSSDTKWEYTELEPIGVLEDWTYIEISPMLRKIRYDEEYLYFQTFPQCLYRYSLVDGTVSSPCTDPLCPHLGRSSCKMGRHMMSSFYDVHNGNIIYEDGNMYLYSYNMATMENILIDNRGKTSSFNSATVSDKYAYIQFYIEDRATNYVYNGYRQIDYKTGKSNDIFGAEASSPAYRLVGAFGGKLYLNDPEMTATYVCDEEDVENVKKFWDRYIGRIWVGNDNICFISMDPEDDASDENSERYIFRTDFEGNIISKTKLEGGFAASSLCDGRHLYCIPSGSVPLYLSDGTRGTSDNGEDMNGHSREVYCLDIETGERELVFTFDGDFSAFRCKFGAGEAFYVTDGKIIISQLSGKKLTEDENGNKKIESIFYREGIVIIDIETGDIKHIHGKDYNSDGVSDIQFREYEMRTGKEMKAEPDGESEAESGD